MQAERAYVSHSALDQEVSAQFFIFGLLNNFLMVVLSGGTFGQIGAFLQGNNSESLLCKWQEGIQRSYHPRQ